MNKTLPFHTSFRRILRNATYDVLTLIFFCDIQLNFGCVVEKKSCNVVNSINGQLHKNIVNVMLDESVNEVTMLITTQIQTITANLHYNVTNAFSQENDMHRTARLTISLSDSLMYLVLCLLNSFSEVKAPLITAIMAYYLQFAFLYIILYYILYILYIIILYIIIIIIIIHAYIHIYIHIYVYIYVHIYVYIYIYIYTCIYIYICIDTRKVGDLGSTPSECQIFHLFRCVLSSMLPLRSVGRYQFRKGFA